MEIVRSRENPQRRYQVKDKQGEWWLICLLNADGSPTEETHWVRPTWCTPDGVEPVTAASKDNVKDRKPPYRYISKELLDQCAYAMLAGETKYGAWNYLKGHTALQLIEAMERHLAELKSGIDFDKDCSDRIGRQVHHLGNVLANVNMYLTQLKVGTLTDDRPEVITNAYKTVS